MVGLVPKKGKQYPPSAGLFRRLLRGLDGHEDRIDPRQDLRIVKRQHPAPVVRVIAVKDTQTSDWLLRTKPFTPYVGRNPAACGAKVIALNFAVQ